MPCNPSGVVLEGCSLPITHTDGFIVRIGIIFGVVVVAEAEIGGGREADTGGCVMIVPQVSFQEVPFNYVELAPFLTLEPFIALGLSFITPHGV